MDTETHTHSQTHTQTHTHTHAYAHKHTKAIITPCFWFLNYELRTPSGQINKAIKNRMNIKITQLDQ